MRLPKVAHKKAGPIGARLSRNHFKYCYLQSIFFASILGFGQVNVQVMPTLIFLRLVFFPLRNTDVRDPETLAVNFLPLWLMVMRRPPRLILVTGPL